MKSSSPARFASIDWDVWRRRINCTIVLLVIVCAIGVALCWVTAVNQRAKRSQCKDRLRWLGLAMHGYIENHYAFPYGTLPNDTLPPGERLSWVVDIIPYFQGGPNPVAGIRRDKSWRDPVNLPFASLSFPDLFTCPAARIQDSSGMGATTYVGIAGIGENAANLTEDDPRVGMFGYDRQTKQRDITDDPSTTMVIVETGFSNGPWIAGGTPTVRGLDLRSTPYLGYKQQFGGLHTGGANALFVDGTVRFISDRIDPKLFESLLTIHGGERVSLTDIEKKRGRE